MRRLVILLPLICFVVGAQAQHEIGISLGTSHLLGDFGGGPGNGTIFLKDLDLPSTSPSFGLFYRYNFARFLAVRGQFLYGGLNSNDNLSGNFFRFDRGLKSASNLFDLSAHVEFNFIPLQFCSGKTRFTPYVAGGVGVSKVNPVLSSNNMEGIAAAEYEYIDESGNGIALNLPISVGVKLKTKKNLVLGVETSYRMSFSDKLDNYVRQQNDQFFFVNANLSYVFCKGGSVGKMSKQVRCPRY